ncbi:MAG: hypothetical protein HUJ61_03225 [Bacilli bacterium]|nr:hypothetical protein [Bacilli bacterium]
MIITIVTVGLKEYKLGMNCHVKIDRLLGVWKEANPDYEIVDFHQFNDLDEGIVKGRDYIHKTFFGLAGEEVNKNIKSDNNASIGIKDRLITFNYRMALTWFNPYKDKNIFFATVDIDNDKDMHSDQWLELITMQDLVQRAMTQIEHKHEIFDEFETIPTVWANCDLFIYQVLRFKVKKKENHIPNK